MTTTAGASKFFPKAQEGFTTTTSGLVASGASTVGLNSTGNYSNGDTVVLIIDPGVVSKEQSFTGVIDTSGVQVTGVVWLSGTNVPHVSGATVVDYVAAGHIDLISAGALVSHNADGTPKTGVTYPASTFTTPTITDFTNADHTHATAAQGGQLTASSAITPATITNALLSTTTGELGGAWQSWTPTWTNLTIGSGTNTGRYLQIGKVVHFHLRTVLSSSTMGSAPKFTLPVTASSNYNFTTTEKLFPAHLEDQGNATYIGFGFMDSSTTMTLQVYNASATYLQNSAISSTVPFTWGDTDSLCIQGFYEAA